MFHDLIVDDGGTPHPASQMIETGRTRNNKPDLHSRIVGGDRDITDNNENLPNIFKINTVRDRLGDKFDLDVPISPPSVNGIQIRNSGSRSRI